MPNEYQNLAARTECNQDSARLRMTGTIPSYLSGATTGLVTNIRLMHGCMGVTKEGGELLSLCEKLVYYGQRIRVEDIAKEAGDVLWYLAEILNAVGLQMEDVMKANIAKLRARYPESYTDEKALHRDLEAEDKAVAQVGVHEVLKEARDAYNQMEDKKE